jgi:hypothetical protein
MVGSIWDGETYEVADGAGAGAGAASGELGTSPSARTLGQDMAASPAAPPRSLADGYQRVQSS